MIIVPDSTRPIAQIAEFYSFEHLSHFTKGTLSRLLSDSGFDLVKDAEVLLLNGCQKETITDVNAQRKVEKHVQKNADIKNIKNTKEDHLHHHLHLHQNQTHQMTGKSK